MTDEFCSNAFELIRLRRTYAEAFKQRKAEHPEEAEQIDKQLSTIEKITWDSIEELSERNGELESKND